MNVFGLALVAGAVAIAMMGVVSAAISLISGGEVLQDGMLLGAVLVYVATLGLAAVARTRQQRAAICTVGTAAVVLAWLSGWSVMASSWAGAAGLALATSVLFAHKWRVEVATYSPTASQD